MAPLSRAIQQHAKQWIDCYGNVLMESAKTGLNALRNRLEDKSDDLESTPNSLDDLKFVLSTISDIKNMSLEVEDTIRDLQERYRVLDMYDLTVWHNSILIHFFFFLSH